MRPIRLTIEGLRSFRAPVTVDFDGRNQVAIIGDTGAGKSSILEAITYALYGQTTFSGKANQELMNDTSTHLRVVLRFRVSGQEWEVARTLQRAKDRSVGTPKAQLRRLDDAGNAVEMVEQVRPVDSRIQDVIGLDSDAFLRTVILPQGRFARLLVEDKPADRSRILSQVWRTDELEAAGAAAGAARQEIAVLRARLAQAASEYPADPAAHLAWLRRELSTAQAAAAAADALERDVSASHAALTAAKRDAECARGVGERLRTCELDAVATTLRPIVALAGEVDGAIAELEQRRATVADDLACIPSDDDGASSAEVGTALARLEEAALLAAEAEQAAKELRVSVGAAAEARESADRAAQAVGRARQEAERHGADRPALAAAVDAARARCQTVERAHERCRMRSEDVAKLQARHDRLQREQVEIAGRCAAARADERRFGQAAAAAADHLAAVRRTDSAAAAASGMHPGDECPICRRDLPTDWVAPAGGGLETAETVASEAAEMASAARAQAARLGSEADATGRQIGEAAVELRTAKERYQEALQVLGREVDLGTGADLPDPHCLGAPLESALREASEALDRHDRAAGALRAEAADADRIAGVAGEAADNAKERSREAGNTAVERVGRFEATVAAIPEVFQPVVDLPADPVALVSIETDAVRAMTEAARHRREVLAERSAARGRLHSEREALDREVQALSARRADEVDAPLDAVVQDVNEHRDLLGGVLAEMHVDEPLPAAVTTRHASVLEQAIEELRGLTARLLRAADDQAVSAGEAVRAAQAQLSAIGERLGIDLLQAGGDGIVEAARHAAQEARFSQRAAAQRTESFSAVLDDIVGLRSLLAEVEEKERALNDLDSALKPGAFAKWLALRRSRSLLVHASRMLGEMSDGRYAFADFSEADAQWRVLDRDSGQARSPASLSGGEQFIASLSLALGLVEMMARSGGRLESLFLDEGFGALDRNNLDAAIEALGMVAAGGRMVVLISHVQAVAEQVADVAAVTRTHAGSRIEWLSGAERRDLGESEAGSAALGGLLE